MRRSLFAATVVGVVVLAGCSSAQRTAPSSPPTDSAAVESGSSLGSTDPGSSGTGPGVGATTTGPPAADPTLPASSASVTITPVPTTTQRARPVKPKPPPTTTVAASPARPYTVFVPSAYHAGTPTALVVLLHGYGVSGAVQNLYFQFDAQAEQRGFLSVHPDGTKNIIGGQFWNATDACCGFGSTVDDDGYIMSIIDQVSARYTVDPKRIFLLGHSNGGFLAYRLACNHADRIAAIASLAGDTWLDPAKCKPSQPVSVLQAQGTADRTITYDGGSVLFGIQFPGSVQTASMWAAYNGCSATSAPGPGAVDLLPSIAGSETSTATFGGCPPGIDVELWTMQGAPHIPGISPPDNSPPPLVAEMLDFLFAHPKP